MRTLLFAFASSIAVLASTTSARAEPPHRQGFTLELGLGLAYTATSSNVSGPGLAGLSLGAGGFVTPDIAILLRVAGTSFWHDYGPPYGSTQIENVVSGPVVEGWLSDTFYLSAGPGIAAYGPSPFSSSSLTTRHGFGFDLRGGYAFSTLEHHAFVIAFELIPTFYGETNGVSGTGATIFGAGVAFEWHYF